MRSETKTAYEPNSLNPSQSQSQRNVFQTSFQPARMALYTSLRPSTAAAAAAPAATRRPRHLLAPKPRIQLLQCNATIQLPPDLQAELDELEKAQYCGNEGMCACRVWAVWWCGPSCKAAHVLLCLCFPGHVLVREAPQDVEKNGKKYHIHTFGCQVSCCCLLAIRNGALWALVAPRACCNLP